MSAVGAGGRRLALVLALALLAGCGGAEPSIGSMILSKGRVASGKQATTPFVSGEPVHCLIELKDDPGGSSLRGRVAALLVDGLRRGEIVDAMARTTVEADGPAYDLAYDEAALPPGTYEFAVWLNAAKDEAPTRVIKFKVVPRGTDPLPEGSPEPSDDPQLEASPAPVATDDGTPVVSQGPFSEIYLTRRDDETPEMASRAFQDPVKQLWCHAVVRKPKPGQVVLIRFVAEQVAGARREQVLHQSRVVLTKGVDYAQFPLKGEGGGPLPKGRWRADLQFREATDTQASIRFTIE